MSGNGAEKMARKIRVVLPVILRITFCLAMWTLGATPMTLAEGEEQTKEHRAVNELRVDRVRMKNLQRWVNAGHDAWCRDAKSVATRTIQRISPEFANCDFELASLTTQDRKPSAKKAVYTFHSLDGRNSYRVTLRRFAWQTKTAGSPNDRIWVPVKVETITRDSLD